MASAAISAELLERDRDLTALAELLDGARSGRGAAVLLEGPAGIGKSSLLDACAEQAEARRFGLLRVRGDELVMESSFAGVRELFWPELRAVGVDGLEGAARLALPVFEAGGRSESDRDRVSSVLHGLYWLASDLAEHRPLALLIDDAQWLDAASARFMIYLARRIEGLPILLAVALRAGEPRGQEIRPALAAVVARILKPSPLSEEASGELVRRVLGPRADEELCRSCHEATRGNPFYLHELAVALAAPGARPSLELAHRVRTLGAGAIGASVLLRLGRLGADCERLAQALAILGPQASLRHAAALAGLDRDRAQGAADALDEAELLSAGTALSFVHPIVSEAVTAQLSPAHRASLHARAAWLLAADEAPADRVAAHLLSAQPYGDAWVVEALRLAARDALGRGACEAAVSYLRRAIAEPPSPDERVDVLFELGRAEALLPTTQDFTSLRAALAHARDPRQRAEIALELSLALFGVLRNTEGLAVVDDALRDEQELDDEIVERLEQALIGGGIGDLKATPRVLTRAERYFARFRDGQLRDPRMLTALAITAAVGGGSAAEASELARQALKDERLRSKWLDDGYVAACATLCVTDHLGEAAEAAKAGLAAARRRGSAPMLLQLSFICADVALRAGDLDSAEDYAQRTYDMGRELGADHIAAAWLPRVLIERGQVDAAADLVEPLRVDPEADQFDIDLLALRGKIRIARGQDEAGLVDVLEADQRWAEARLCLSVSIDWVPAATLALRRLGRLEEARALTSRELESAAAFGAPRRYGVALSASGSVEPGEVGLARLSEAIGIIERCGARLEHARALVNLGAGLRERGAHEAARAPLAEGLDLAHRCGALALAERAREELTAAGARPRRNSVRGPEALTPAELRVARMAADGLTNRQIAQALFVSAKTVETQLSKAYAKLGISSRAALAEALRSATASSLI